MALNTQPHSTEDQEVQALDFANQASEAPTRSIESEILPSAAIEEAQNVRIVSDDPVELSASAKDDVPFEDRTMDRVDATILGNAIDSGRDIRLPLIGHLPLQKQIRYLLIAMSLSLALSAFFVWLNASQSALISTQAQISGEI